MSEEKNLSWHGCEICYCNPEDGGSRKGSNYCASCDTYYCNVHFKMCEPCPIEQLRLKYG